MIALTSCMVMLSLIGLVIPIAVEAPSRNDWIFIGCNDGSIVRNGKQLTGRCFQKNGKQYHYIGYRAPSSASQLVRERTGTYKETYRLYFECR